MKKTFKKLFAALLAAALVLAMAVPAFAVTNATKGSITISKTVKDETYTIYRMFKLDLFLHRRIGLGGFLQDGCRWKLHHPGRPEPPHLDGC